MYYVAIYICCVVFLLAVVFFQRIEIKNMKRQMGIIKNMKNTLYSVGNKIPDIVKEDSIYYTMLDAAISLINQAKKGCILILDDDGLFHFKAFRGFVEDIKTVTLKKSDIFLSNINNFRETAIINDIEQFDRQRITGSNLSILERSSYFSIGSVLSAPIYIDDRLIGVINLYSSRKGAEFSDASLTQMKYVKNEFQLILKNYEIQKKLRYMANYDELTNVFNRRYLKYLLNSEIEKVKKYRSVSSISLIDIDHFKYINDNFGHTMGDNTLKNFVRILRSTIKKPGFYGRMSGDEFLIVFSGMAPEKAKEQIDEIKKKVNSSIEFPINLKISTSIVSISYDDNFSIDDLLSRADIGLCREKSIKKGNELKQSCKN